MYVYLCKSMSMFVNLGVLIEINTNKNSIAFKIFSVQNCVSKLPVLRAAQKSQ